MFYVCFLPAFRRVSVGLTDRRKTAKNLTDSRKNWKILAVIRKQSKKELTVKKVFPRFVTFKEGTKLTYGCVLYLPAGVTTYAG